MSFQNFTTQKNCVMVLLSSLTVPNWFYFAAQLTELETSKAPPQVILNSDYLHTAPFLSLIYN